jgi:drug/metabolite transporter superfamily protein YnfA
MPLLLLLPLLLLAAAPASGCWLQWLQVELGQYMLLRGVLAPCLKITCGWLVVSGANKTGEQLAAHVADILGWL